MPRKIYITESDKEKLQKLVDDLIKFNLEGVEYVRDLEKELERALIIKNINAARNVITMHTEVRLTLDDIEEEIVTLVYPNEVDITENKISVLSPIGTAILGYCEGDTIQWNIPNGVVKIIIKQVLRNPKDA